MVTTRSMSIPGTKTSVNGDAAQRESITTAAAQRATGIAVNDEAVQDQEIPGFRKLINLPGWTVMEDAYCFFAEDFKEKNQEKFPRTPSGAVISKELLKAIEQQWGSMSSKDKAPYVKSAEEMRARGLTKLLY